MDIQKCWLSSLEVADFSMFVSMIPAFLKVGCITCKCVGVDANGNILDSLLEISGLPIIYEGRVRLKFCPDIAHI